MLTATGSTHGSSNSLKDLKRTSGTLLVLALEIKQLDLLNCLLPLLWRLRREGSLQTNEIFRD